MHGGVKKDDLKKEDLKALEAGMANLARHVENVQKFGIVPVVSINRFSADTDAEIALVKEKCKALGVEALMADHWAMGGEGAADVARAVVKVCDSGKTQAEAALSRRHAAVREDPHHRQGNLPRQGRRPPTRRCATSSRIVRGHGLRQGAGLHRQDAVFSFSTNGDLKGAPTDHTINVREVRLSAGAEFVVAICGEIMTMPGLPRVPAADSSTSAPDGRIVGLF